MHGPLLPIYGSGAITMLFTTLPVRNNPVLIFVVASLSATVLEFVTGTVMESLFKVRYWDYTRYKLNYKGHICLVASILWGTAGVVISLFINKPLDILVRSVPEKTEQLIAFAITVVAACDFGASFREAMDIRDILVRLSNEKDRQIKRLEKRVDVMAAVYGEEIEKGKEIVSRKTAEYMDKLDEIKESGQEKMEIAKAKIDSMTEYQKKRIMRYIRSNPDAESKHRSISDMLKVLKGQTFSFLGRMRTQNKE